MSLLCPFVVRHSFLFWEMVYESGLLDRFFCRKRVEELFNHSFKYLLLQNISRYDDEHIVLCIELFFVLKKIFLCKSAYVVLSTYDLPTVAVVSVHVCLKFTECLTVGPVFIHFKLLYNHSLFSFHLIFRKCWMHHHVC